MVLIRRQNFIYLTMLAAGSFLMVTSQLADQRLLSEGIAFIMVGLVGMVMSLTTMDIGARIKEEIREIGRQNAESSAGIKEAIREIGRQNAESSAGIKEAIREIGRQNAESSAGKNGSGV